MIKFLIVFLTMFSSLYAAEKIELGSEYIIDKNFDNSDSYVKYTTITKKEKDEYGIKLGRRYFFYEQVPFGHDYYVELSQIYNTINKGYWENYFLISNKQEFMPSYQVELNRYWVTSDEELGLGVRYLEYKKNAIITPTMQAMIYINKGDYIVAKAFFTYFKEFRPYYAISYNAYITDNLTFKPYFYFGNTIEDIGYYDKFTTIGLESTYKWSPSVKTKIYGEKYSGEIYRKEETKVGFSIEFGF